MACKRIRYVEHAYDGLGLFAAAEEGGWKVSSQRRRQRHTGEAAPAIGSRSKRLRVGRLLKIAGSGASARPECLRLPAHGTRSSPDSSTTFSGWPLRSQVWSLIAIA